MLTIERFTEFLERLSEECKAIDKASRLQRIDLVCPPKAVDNSGKVVDSPIARCIRIFNEFGISYDSPITGAVASRDDKEVLCYVEVIEEQMACNAPRASRPVATVYGVDFETFSPKK